MPAYHHIAFYLCVALALYRYILFLHVYVHLSAMNYLLLLLFIRITTATYMLYLNHDEEFNICLLLKCY